MHEKNTVTTTMNSVKQQVLYDPFNRVWNMTGGVYEGEHEFTWQGCAMTSGKKKKNRHCDAKAHLQRLFKSHFDLLLEAAMDWVHI